MGRLAIGKGKVEKECLECHKIFMARHDRPGKFCSKSCAGKQHIQIKKRVNLICEVCINQYEVKLHRANTSKTCSKECRVVYLSTLMSGSNHPNWKGGISERDHASRAIISRLKEERGCCEICKATNNLHGHHKQEWSKNIELRYDPENIMILCGDCHALQHPELAGMLRPIKERKGVYLECEECDKIYYVVKHKEKTSHTCSRECAMKRLHKLTKGAKTSLVILLCDECSGLYSIAPAKAAKSKACSRICNDKLNSKMMMGNRFAVGEKR